MMLDGFTLYWFGLIALALTVTWLAAREAERPDPSDRLPPWYAPSAYCLACGDRYPVDGVEAHLLARHTRHERTDR